MSEELIKEYKKNNKKLFSINNIDVMRNGGTIKLESFVFDRITFYINPDSYTIHFSHPTTEDNKVNDKPTIAYIFDCLEKYKQKKEKEVSEIISLIGKVSDAQS